MGEEALKWAMFAVLAVVVVFVIVALIRGNVVKSMLSNIASLVTSVFVV